uniref:Fibronectin type-III domain-containing protein n=1 Tax=Paramormyrops kingsleyae TaxID=1676925 RepID=A0A3B3Q9X0_9TELE
MSTLLCISECTRNDSGQYAVTGKNILGTLTEIITVKVHDIPGPPKGPIHYDRISNESITISWDPPENDGGVPINNYIVEFRDTTSTSWSVLSTTIIRTVFKAERLTPRAEYQFRVKAKNRYGVGPPITSESVVAAYPFKVPGPPGTPQVIGFTKDTMTISWNEPVNDGGSEVIGYHIERKERNSILWQKVSSALIVGNIFKSIGLEAGIAYEFRVAAENIAGVGKPSKPSEPSLALDPVDPPGTPVAINISKNFVNIKWTKPNYDGGFKITGYTVEKKDLPNGRWIKVNYSNIQETTFTVSGLTEGASYEFRVLARNSAGAVSSPSEPSDPIGVEVVSITKDSMVVIWSAPDNDGGSSITGYVIEKHDKEGIRWTKCNKHTVTELSFKVKGLFEGHNYEFRVSAENDAGVGKSSSPSIYYMAIDPVFRPGPPNSPKVTNISRTSVFLSWEKPIYDGGCDIQGYIIEACEATSEEWKMCTLPTGIKQTQYEVEKLKENQNYKFRVFAINKVGVGECSKISEGYVACDPCDPPGTPEPIIVNKNAITIQWAKPEYDGGSIITGYIVEKRDLPDGRWMKANFTNVTETQFTVSGLTEDSKYDFRVIAKNAAGTISKPSYNTGPITARDEVEPPRLSLDPEYSQAVVVSAGSTFKLDADVYGKPTPTVQWFKEDKGIENTLRCEIKRTDLRTILTVANVAGTKIFTFYVKVLDSPGPCGGMLNVSAVTSETCTLSWLPPEHDGNSNISHYIIERRETSRLAWTVVASKCDVTSFKVNNLLEGNEYIFRVMAVNSYGVGEPLESSPVTIKNPFLLPGSPQSVEVTNIAKDSMTVFWSSPESDGGSEITGYIIEKKDKTGIRWTKCNRQTITDLSFRVTGLTEDHEYEFRISAENMAGLGEPSLPTSYYKACNPKFKPGPPTHVHVTDTTKNSVSLAWGKPIYDGGCVIQGYIVEICKADEEEWIMCTPATGLPFNKLDITKLTENKEYKIQVCAINKLGIGEPAAIPGTVKVQDKIEPPGLTIDSELRKGIIVLCIVYFLYVQV